MSDAAGWNQTEDDWRRLLALDADGCFGCDCDGRLVATTTLLCHGPELAWLGMVLTHPDYRRRGYAGMLVETALALAEHRGIRCVKLDATEQGRPLYQRCGFEDEQPIERWAREPSALEASLASPDKGIPDIALDRAAFGCARSRFLAALGPAWSLENGFVMQRAGSRARYLGPCVARDSREIEAVIRAVIAARPEEPWIWDLLPLQTEAVRIAHGLGFKPVRRLMRMRRGVELPAHNDLVYAISGFEAG